ncbi:26664_t:CDS:2, partial [Dentiscutata erythropus]
VNLSRPKKARLGQTNLSPAWVRLFYVDRIDQESRPLDNKYSYPDCEIINILIGIKIFSDIDIIHPEFEGREKYGKSVRSGCPPCSYDDHDHGTHIAGAGSHTYDVAKNLLSLQSRHYQKRKKSSIVNISLGGGNSKDDACNSSPSLALPAIAVGAVQNTDNDALSSYSNIGPCIPMYAPGP